MFNNDTLIARESMFAQIQFLWDTGCAEVFGNTKPIEWATIVLDQNATAQLDCFARCSIRYTEKQGAASLADSTGVKYWERSGILTLQIFVPLATKNFYDIAEQLCTTVRTGFEKTQSCIIYKQPSVLDMGRDNGYYNFNFITRFSYTNVH